MATVLRDLGIENTSPTASITPGVVPNRDTLGWGVQLTGAVRTFDGFGPTATDALLFGGVYGRGVASFVKDLDSLDGVDAAFDANNDLRPLPVWGLYASYTHFWRPALQSSLVCSQVELDPTGFQGFKGETYRRGRYLAANLAYTWPLSKTAIVFAGVEYLYGWKETLDGATGSAQRVMLAVGAKQ